MKNVLVSIIVPFHNTVKNNRSEMMNMLCKSIPDRDDIEVIWIDDRSEKPWIIPTLHNHTKNKIIPNSPGMQYAGTARNTGITAARGKWLMFADSDDIYDTNTLCVLLRRLASEKNDVVFFMAGSLNPESPKKRRVDFINRSIKEAMNGKMDALFGVDPPTCKVIKRDFILDNNIQYGPSPVANDTLFATRVLLANPEISFFDEVVYLFRDGHVSLTSDMKRSTILTRIAVAKERQDILRMANRDSLTRPLIITFRHALKSKPFTVAMALLSAQIRGYHVFPGFSAIWRKIKNF